MFQQFRSAQKQIDKLKSANENRHKVPDEKIEYGTFIYLDFSRYEGDDAQKYFLTKIPLRRFWKSKK